MRLILGKPSRSGPEADLVEEFIQTGLPTSYKGKHRSVFIEPAIGNTRPDIVVVYLDQSITANWPEARLCLKRGDLGLVQLLYAMSGPLTEGGLLKYYPRKLRNSLERLERAELIEQIDGLWYLRKLPDIFAVRHIIAFEAKISSLSKAIEQAFYNTWFSSQSYVLTNVKQPTAEILHRAERQGVGLWSFSKGAEPLRLVAAKEQCLPQSPATWQINELAWRASLGSACEFRY